jgi:hypothetical protein
MKMIAVLVGSTLATSCNENPSFDCLNLAAKSNNFDSLHKMVDFYISSDKSTLAEATVRNSFA